MITYETNNYGRTFLLINGSPTFISWNSEDEKPEITQIGRKVYVNGQLVKSNFISGVMDNRSRNWKRRAK